MEFLHSVLAQDESITVSTTVTYDLPTNPLSAVLFTLLFANDTGTITDYSAVEAALAQVSKVEILYRGQAIISGSLADVARLMEYVTGIPLGQVQQVDTNNAYRSLTVPLCLGRTPYNPAECYPETKKGELQLQITYAAAQTGIDTLKAQIETVELLGATPDMHLKATTHSVTPTAAGDIDIDLPIGNILAGALLYSTTTPAGATTTKSVEDAKLLVNNVERYFAKTNWETQRGIAQARAPMLLHNQAHLHYLSSVAAAGDTDQQETGVTGHEKYIYLDLDPMKDGNFLLETGEASKVVIRVTAGDTNAIRCLPVELVKVGG